ncbi:MAG TPA: EB domain-containing protein, partial [Polyangia bacterium]|nr:EB domain-containing protein [Polyangia bacterium]
MIRAWRIAAALVVVGCIAGTARTAVGGTYDPFRTAGKADGGERALDPFRRVAQALPVPPAEEPAKTTPPVKAETPTKTPASAPATPAAKSCQKDEDCPEGNICQSNVCQKIELSTNLFPIYYREGSFKEIALLYWSRSGVPGYTVVFPFYWHFYSQTSDSFVIAPFYWHFTDSARGSELTVVPPFSWSHEPGAHSFAIWPLFYASNKFGWAIPILGTFNVGDSKIGNQYGAALFLYWWKRSQRGAFNF